MPVTCGNLAWSLTRRKAIPTKQGQEGDTPLRRCLTTFDLVMIGVGNMIGAGVFILTGTIAREKTGPGVVLAYLVAGFAVILASLCYAEFGARVPKAGSAYNYTYVTMGELWAFVIGWDLVLERMLGVAAVAKGFSAVLDAAIGNAIQNATLHYVGEIHVLGLSHYPDFLAFGVIVCDMIVASIGVRFMANTNNLFTMLNILALFAISGLCFWHADWDNWSNASRGGFLPYGFQGVVAGAATLFYTYVGFESIATGGEEASNPSVQIPRATLLAMTITTTIYIMAGASLTLMVPFNHINPESAFTSAFLDIGMHWAAILVSVGALLGIVTTLFADMFALPRIVYAMASDGLFFSCFSWVHPKTQTPLLAIWVFGTVAATVCLLVDYVLLVSVLAVGTLLSFTMVSLSVLFQRYRAPLDDATTAAPATAADKSRDDETSLSDVDPGDDARYTSEKLPIIGKANQKDEKRATDRSWAPILKKEFRDVSFLRGVHGDRVIGLAVGAMVVFAIGLALLFKYSSTDVVMEQPWWLFVVLPGAILGVLVCLFFMSVYEQTNVPEHFSVPLVPYLPAVSIMINVLLLIQLDVMSLVRFAVWMIIGMIIYFSYGIHHSIENISTEGDSNSGTGQYQATGPRDPPTELQTPAER